MSIHSTHPDVDIRLRRAQGRLHRPTGVVMASAENLGDTLFGLPLPSFLFPSLS